MDIGKLSPFAEDGTLNVVVETPRGSRNKDSLNKESGLFLLKKVLPVGMSFPFDLGFVPGTHAPEGDPVDVLVLMDEPAAVGTLVRCQPIGIFEAVQTEDGKEERNDRLIAQSVTSRRETTSKKLRELSDELIKEIEAFFVNYNALDEKKFKVLRHLGSVRAQAAVRQSVVGRR